MTGRRVVREEAVEIAAKTVEVAVMIEGIEAEKAEIAETKEAEMEGIAETVEMVEKPEIIEIAGIVEKIAGKERM